MNRWGLRCPDFNAQKPPNTFRVICLGNSCTLGSFISDVNMLYASRLRQRLQADHPDCNIEIINAACEGYTVYQMLQYWRRQASHWEPDLVTISAVFNDIVYAPFAEDKNVHLPRLNCSISNFLFSFRVAHAANATLKRVGLILHGGERTSPLAEKADIPRRVSPEDYRLDLEALAREVHQTGAPLVFITAPSRRSYPLAYMPLPEPVQEGRTPSVQWVQEGPIERGWIRAVETYHAHESELAHNLGLAQRYPNWPVAHFKAAYCCEKLGDSTQARALYREADSLEALHFPVQEYNQIMREVARQYDLPVADCEADLMSRPDDLNLYVFDGMHPSEIGHAAIAQTIYPVLSEQFGLWRSHASAAIRQK
jgi:lysophospholipase L1-like esterase